jgi:hypothetical protein
MIMQREQRAQNQEFLPKHFESWCGFIMFVN